MVYLNFIGKLFLQYNSLYGINMQKILTILFSVFLLTSCSSLNEFLKNLNNQQIVQMLKTMAIRLHLHIIQKRIIGIKMLYVSVIKVK